MTPEERSAEALNDAVDALLAGHRPASGRRQADPELLRTAALLASVEAPQAQPSAAFVASLRDRLNEPRPRWFEFRLTRRGLTRGLAGGVAALAVCLFGEQMLERVRGGEVPAGWVPVARAAELTPGTVKRFVAGDVDGHIMNIGGKIWALSAVCTHMACLLDWSSDRGEFLCGCHGAQFDTEGHQTGVDDYKVPLPPLARIPVEQRDGTIYVVTG